MVSRHEIGTPSQRPKGMGWLVSIVSYSRPSLIIIALASQFHVYLLQGQCLLFVQHGVLNVSTRRPQQRVSVITNLSVAPRKGSFEALTYIDVKIGEFQGGSYSLHPPAAATRYCAGDCVTHDNSPSSRPQHLYLTVSMDSWTMLGHLIPIYVAWSSFIRFYQLN